MRGQAAALIEEKNRMNAVGPNEGKTNGISVTRATTDRIAMVIAEFTNT